MLRNIQLLTYDLNTRVNWTELNPDGTNPLEDQIAPLEEYINKVFSSDKDIGVLHPEFWATLTKKQQEKVFADYDEAWDNVQQMRRTIKEAYNQFHHGAPREVNMDASHDESGDEAEGDIQGMGLRGRGATISLSVDPVRVIEDKRSGLPDRGSMFHAGLNRLYGGANPSPLALRLKQITDKWSARMREAHVPYEELFREMRRQISVYEQRIQQLQAANSRQINNPLASPNPWAANEVRDLAQKIDYNNAVMEAADNEYTGIKYNLREQQDAEVAALEIELQDPSHSLYSNSRRMRRGDMS